MLSIVQDSVNTLHIPNITTTESALILTFDGCPDKPVNAPIISLCGGTAKIEITHVCEDTDAFNLDLGSYKVTVSDTTGVLTNTDIHIYKNFL